MEEVPRPSAGAGELLVEMKACGLCGSDLEKMEGEYTAAPPVLGHEAVGVVVDVGAEAAGFEVGQRVFPHHHVPCYDCHYCRRGSETMCAQYRRWHLDPGGFAEFFRVPRWNVERGGVLPLPDSLSFDEGTFIEPLACCIRALDRLGVREEDLALVAGAGPMGLLLQQLLPAWGASRVVVSEMSPTRLEVAGRLGAYALLNPREDDVVKEALRLTEGRGVDLAVVATGSPRALEQALAAVRRGGKVALVGIPEVGAPLDDVSRLVTREVSLISSNAATEKETRHALELLRKGRVDVASLVTHRVPLESFSRAVELARTAEAVKVLVTP